MKTINKLKAKYWYGQPPCLMIILVATIITGILCFIVPQRIILPFLLVEVIAFLICICISRKAKYDYYTIMPDVFRKNRYCLNQKSKLSQNKACPKERFLMELNSIIETMPEGAIYHASTHGRVISIMKKHPLVKSGKVELVVYPYSYEGNLKGIEKKLWNACCKTCTTEECRIRKAHNEHSKEKETFYAVELRKVAK